APRAGGRAMARELSQEELLDFLCQAGGRVRALFLEEPQLALQRDFISGYTALHWIAKHGANQVLQDLVSGAEKAGTPLDVNVKSSCGYTPLHLAAIHGHQRIMKLLVQELNSKVNVRDSSGKRPWQYLSSSTSGEMWQLLGSGRSIVTDKAAGPARSGEHVHKTCVYATEPF
uniref:Sosondowah ankyrin repeat domain family member B n=1 Tax=Chrysemys picta bellii TaxID=8478 RepID=A0A8C3I2U7_CHRPI